MYAPAVIAAQQEKLEASLGEALPTGKLERLPAPQCHSLRRSLDEIWDPEKGQQTRDLTQDEQAFVANERLLGKIDYVYFAERYWFIQAAGQRLQPMFPLFESQQLMLAALAEEQERRWRIGHPDGLIPNVLKGRQLGCSSWAQSLIGHRIVTHGYVKALVASDVPENSGSQGIFGMLERGFEHLPWWLKPGVKFHNKDRHLVLANGSSVIVESGKSMKGGLQEEGGTKGQLGRSKTYSVGHLTELSTWERAEQIDDGLMPAVPMSPQTLLIRESTAKGRHNWWHQEWEVAAKGLGRSFNIFIPWYAERSKYWLPFPPDWIPATDTLEFATRVREKGARFMRRTIDLSKEQLYWYEQRKAEAVQKEQLYKFLEEYPAEPEEAFQFSGRSVFPISVIDRVERQARPLLDLWAVRPHADLKRDREALISELRSDQQGMQQRAEAERLKRAEMVSEQIRPMPLALDPIPQAEEVV